MQDKELAELALVLALLTIQEPEKGKARTGLAKRILAHLKIPPYFKAEKGGE